jgi:hypothetical protein
LEGNLLARNPFWKFSAKGISSVISSKETSSKEISSKEISPKEIPSKDISSKEISIGQIHVDTDRENLYFFCWTFFVVILIREVQKCQVSKILYFHTTIMRQYNKENKMFWASNPLSNLTIALWHNI